MLDREAVERGRGSVMVRTMSSLQDFWDSVPDFDLLDDDGDVADLDDDIEWLDCSRCGTPIDPDEGGVASGDGAICGDCSDSDFDTDD